MITRESIFGPRLDWSAELSRVIVGCQEHLLPYYKIYWVRQGKGKRRKIEEPTDLLLEVQKKLVPLLEQYKLHKAAYACKGRSAVENAARHADAKHVLRVDIKQCYRSIGWRHIVLALDRVMLQDMEAFVEMREATYPCVLTNASGAKSWLPTGAPTSPILCNISLTPLDEKVQALADEYGYTYTRYIDDLHLSTTQPKRRWELIDEVKDLVRAHDLIPHPRKCRWMTNNDNDNLIITGVRIGQQSKVPRKYARKIRARLNRFAMAKMDLDEETRGCLAYIKSVDPTKHDQLIQYYERRLQYVPHNGLSTGTEQSIPGSPGHNCT